jgi:hypothetical protein
MIELELIEESYKQFEYYGTIIIDKILEFDYYSFFRSTTISGFFLYGKIMTFMTKIYKNIYDNFEIVQKIDYTVKYSLKYLHSLYGLYTIEPYRLSWYSNCWIEKTSIDQYIFHEKLSDSKDTDKKNSKYCLIDNYNENWPYDPIFIGKIMSSFNDEPKYYCRRIDGRDTEQDNVDISLFPAIPSDTHFLSVIYKHPEMETYIDLTIDNGWFMEGNEILSSSFVYRELLHQSKSFVFDKYYTLQIIDENINIMELGYYEYIEIKNDSYDILDVNKPYDSSIVIVPSLNEDEDEQTTIYGNVSYRSSDSDSKDM